MNGNSFPEKIRRDIEESKKTLQELEKVIISMVFWSAFTTTILYVDHQGLALSNNTWAKMNVCFKNEVAIP